MRKDVRDFVRACPACQKMARLKRVITAPRFTVTDLEPWRTISIDLMGPYPISVDGHEYLLVVVDTFSRYVELYPQQTKSAEESAKSLLQTIGRHGCPSYILTDSGSEFRNDIIEQLCKYLGVRRRFTHPDSHQENAISERFNQEIDKHLRHITNEKRSKYQWSEYLPLVQRILNASEHSVLGVAPHDLIFATNRLDTSIFGVNERPPKKLVPYVKFVDDFLVRHEENLHKAQLLELDRQQRHLLQKQTKATELFDVGTLVMRRPTVNPLTGKAVNKTRLDSKWRGPYVITQRLDDDVTYELKHTATAKETTAQVYDLKIYQPQWADDDYILKTFQAAAMDTDNVALQRVIEHKFIKLPITDSESQLPNANLFFLVEYKDLPSHDTRWVPWAVVKSQPLIHEYMQRDDVGLRKLIPKHTRRDSRPATLDEARTATLRIALNDEITRQQHKTKSRHA